METGWLILQEKDPQNLSQLRFVTPPPSNISLFSLLCKKRIGMIHSSQLQTHSRVKTELNFIQIHMTKHFLVYFLT